MRTGRLRVIASGEVDHTTTTLFTRTIRKLIAWAGTALAMIFTWIQFKQFPLDMLASSYTPILLWHGGLALYYVSWVFGTKFDVDVQELVYVSFPRRGQVPVHGFVTVLLLVVAGAALLWTERDIQKFAIAIDIFIVADHVAWRYLIWLVKNVVRTSKNAYTQRG
ncbi:MAG: hypothetical protein JNM48_07215, partial [Rhodospirillales bacterium]|nr:hypothetical protein [Rhodospirillales bacterium]